MTQPRLACLIRIALTITFCLVPLLQSSAAQEPQQPWFDRQTEWNGYTQYHFAIADRPAYLVAPKQVAPGRPWVWRARFPGYHAEMDVALLGKGFHVAYVDVAGMFGSPTAMKVGDQFYEYLTTRHGLSPKPALEGVSRGGLFVYNWAAQNPDRVACIYADTPVCDFKSWPGGKGTGLGSQGDWQQCLQAYGLNEEEGLSYRQNPVDHAATLAAAKIPLLHIVAENDRVVPPAENTYLLKSRLEELGHKLEVISVAEGTEQSNGHHFDHPAPDRVVAFIARHAGTAAADPQALLRRSRRIVFLGDSITYAGTYIGDFEAWLLTQKMDHLPVVIDIGLPSETVSGLSEEGHAGGQFPRPDVAERLERVLAITKPDLVLACYGINCGIYQPFDEDRFESYQRGIENLRKHVEQAGAILILVTPPSFDDVLAKKPFSYNEVLDRYSQWLLDQRQNGTLVVDVHGPMSRELAKRRETDPGFTFQPDAVHPNAAGHWFIAQTLIDWFGDSASAGAMSPQAMLAAHDVPEEVLAKIEQRLNLLRDAYLGAAGHKRPGIRTGMAITDADEQAMQLTAEVQEAIGNSR